MVNSSSDPETTSSSIADIEKVDYRKVTDGTKGSLHVAKESAKAPVEFGEVDSLGIKIRVIFSFAWLELVSHRSFMPKLLISDFPRNMRLPDPSTPNLKIDLLAEISQPPRILSDVDGALKAKQIKVDIVLYMKTKSEGSPFLTELKQRLLLPQKPSRNSLQCSSDQYTCSLCGHAGTS